MAHRQAERLGGTAPVDREFQQTDAVDEPEALPLADKAETLAVLEQFACGAYACILRGAAHACPDVAVVVDVDHTRQVTRIELDLEFVRWGQVVSGEFSARDVGRNQREQVTAMKGCRQGFRSP